MWWVQKAPPVTLSLGEVSTMLCMMCVEDINRPHGFWADLLGVGAQGESGTGAR